MQKRFFLLILLCFLLTGCVPKAESSLESYRMPTDIPGAASLTETEQAEIAARTPPDSCPLTMPQDPPFAPPPPYSELAYEGYFWYGSNELWVALPQNGVWSQLSQDEHGYGQKLPWWREGYVWDEEPEPPLVVSGERLDGESPPLEASSANGSYAEDMGSAMMMGMNLPTPGCWEITGQYEDAELRFVVWVAP
jgi:hypothetical protein